MDVNVEFSKFYQLLEEVKLGRKEKEEELKLILQEYKSAQNTTGPLQELGQIYCYLGLMELFRYTNEEDLGKISLIEESVWSNLAEKQEETLPMRLANHMIDYTKEKNLIKQIAEKWNIPRRKMNRHIINMARFVTEGLIDVID